MRNFFFLTLVFLVVSCDNPRTRSTNQLINKLDAASVDETVEILSVLTNREIGSEVEKFLIYLDSDDPYVWLNAAVLLGKNKQVEAVPFLIKALNHHAWRSHSEISNILVDLTGEDFGIDFDLWQSWYLESNSLPPGFSWSSYLSRHVKLKVEPSETLQR